MAAWSIPLMVKTPPLQSPVEQQAASLGLQHLAGSVALQKQQQQQNDQIQQENDLKIRAQQRDAEAYKALGDAIASSTTTDPNTGKLVVDHDGVKQKLAAGGYGPMALKYDTEANAALTGAATRATAQLKQQAEAGQQLFEHIDSIPAFPVPPKATAALGDATVPEQDPEYLKAVDKYKKAALAAATTARQKGLIDDTHLAWVQQGLQNPTKDFDDQLRQYGDMGRNHADKMKATSDAVENALRNAQTEQAQAGTAKTKAETSGLVATSDERVTQDAAMGLAAAARLGPDKLQTALNALPHGVASKFVGITSPADILKVAIPPEKQLELSKITNPNTLRAMAQDPEQTPATRAYATAAADDIQQAAVALETKKAQAQGQALFGSTPPAVHPPLTPGSVQIPQEAPGQPGKNQLAFVNSNPGNLRFVNQPGAVAGEGGFAKFAKPEDGYKALQDQIAADSTRGLTLAQYITKYAPPTDNNDTKGYLQQAAQALKVDPSTPLSNINHDALAQFQANKESSTKIAPVSNVGQPTAVATPQDQQLRQFAIAHPSLDNDAWAYMLTGKFNVVGRSKEATALGERIKLRADQIMGDLGLDPGELRARGTELKGNTTAFAKISNYDTMIRAFEGTVQRNAALAQQLSDQFARGDVRLYNRVLTAFKTGVGDTEALNLAAQLHGLSREWGKIMAGSTSAMGVPISEANATDQFFAKGISNGQLSSLINNVIIPDAHNRSLANEAEKQRLLGRVRGVYAPSGAPANPGTTPAAGHNYAHNFTNPKTGQSIGSDDGTTWFDRKTGAKVQ